LFQPFYAVMLDGYEPPNPVTGDVVPGVAGLINPRQEVIKLSDILQVYERRGLFIGHWIILCYPSHMSRAVLAQCANQAPRMSLCENIAL